VKERSIIKAKDQMNDVYLAFNDIHGDTTNDNIVFLCFKMKEQRILVCRNFKINMNLTCIEQKFQGKVTLKFIVSLTQVSDLNINFSKISCTSF